jgi:hypothetical protein
MSALLVWALIARHLDAKLTLAQLDRAFSLELTHERPTSFNGRCPLARCRPKPVEVLDEAALPAIAWTTLPASPTAHFYVDDPRSPGVRGLCGSCGSLFTGASIIAAGAAGIDFDQLHLEGVLAQRLPWVWEACRAQGWLVGLEALPASLLGYVAGLGAPGESARRKSDWAPTYSSSSTRSAVVTLDRLASTLFKRFPPIKAAELASAWASRHLPLTLSQIDAHLDVVAARSFSPDAEFTHGQ